MTEIARTGRVDAPPATVWSVLAEFDRIVEWAPNVGHSSYLTAKQEGIGAARRAQAGSMTLVETVTMWEPERVLGYSIAGLPPVVKRVETRWELAADGEATIVTVTSNVTPGDRPPMKIAAKPVARRLGAANQTMLDGLADAAESRERS